MSRYTLNDTYDDLALTFSTDWLYTHWPVYGLGLSEKKKVKLQAGCRLIVEDMLFIDPKLKASQYWHKSYAPQRIDKTKNLFVDLLNSLNLKTLAILGQLKNWCHYRPFLSAVAAMAQRINRL